MYSIIQVIGVQSSDPAVFIYWMYLFIGLCYCAWTLSHYGEWGLLSSCSAQASHRGDFLVAEHRL